MQRPFTADTQLPHRVRTSDFLHFFQYPAHRKVDLGDIYSLLLIFCKINIFLSVLSKNRKV
jgi:hypothetical protein